MLSGLPTCQAPYALRGRPLCIELALWHVEIQYCKCFIFFIIIFNIHMVFVDSWYLKTIQSVIDSFQGDDS